MGVLTAFLLTQGEKVLWAQPTCKDACYKAKSAAYQQCRQISPNDRAARVACFKKADADLRACLASCK
jgi:hypothetical protein